jgi:drug/metabolite transporter (DMT)-like permease
VPTDASDRSVPRWRLIVAFVTICIVWGSSWAAVRVGLQDVPPAFAAGARFAIATILLAILARVQGLRIPRDRTFLLLTAYLALTAVTIPFALVYWAQERIDSGLSSVLFGTFPFWAAMFAHRALPNERLSIVKLVAIIVGFLGIVVLSGGTRLNAGTMWLASGAIVFSAALQASALVAIRKYGGPYSAVLLNLLPMAFGAIALLGGSVLLENLGTLRFTSQSVGALVYLASFSTVLTFVLYYWLAKHVNAVLLSFSAIITPVVAVFTGWIWLAEPLTGPLLLGSLLVLLGIAIVSAADVRAAGRMRRA